MGDYFDGMHTRTAMEDNLLEELLSIASSDVLAEFGSGNLHLLSQPLSHWEWGDVDDHSLALKMRCGNRLLWVTIHLRAC